MNTIVRRNKRMMTPHAEKGGNEIYWSADNMDEYNFEVTPRLPRQPESGTEVTQEESGVIENAPGVKHSVASYFLTRYGYALKYPKMPIVYTSEGYYPIEFLSQAQERKRGVDAKDYGRNFNDDFAGGEKVDHIQRMKKKVSSIEKNGLDISAIMRQFNLTVSDEPETFEASVLKPPTLKFAGNHDAIIQNGSWNLRGVHFARYDCACLVIVNGTFRLSSYPQLLYRCSPADLNSFAVIDMGTTIMSRKDKAPPKTSNAFMKDLFRAMNTHGMKGLPEDNTIDETLDRVTVKVTGKATGEMNPGEVRFRHI